MIPSGKMNYKIIALIAIFACLGNYTIAQKRIKKAIHQNRNATAAKKIIIKYGIASYYANKFHGRKTATGAIYRKENLTAACNILPLGTWIKVTNLKNDKSVIVRINDRLNSKNKRIIDLSYHAAQLLSYTGQGLTRVKVEVLNDFKIGK
ncbi:MAG: septal ring lytic transglycosylase RlpA family protein [Ginsengibacter sp.]